MNTQAKLKDLGKGKSEKGVNNKVQLTVTVEELGLARSITFWAVIAFQGEKAISAELAGKLISNLELRKNDNGEFYVWNGKL